jgi:hypothetical protein
LPYRNIQKVFKGYIIHPYAQTSKASQDFCMFWHEKKIQRLHAKIVCSKAGGEMSMLLFFKVDTGGMKGTASVLRKNTDGVLRKYT